MTDYAVNKVSELIKGEPTLELLAEVKNVLIKEKSTVDYQLDKQSKKQFSTILSGIDDIKQAQLNVKSLKNNLKEVRQLSKENKSSIKHYEIINSVTTIHELIEKTTLFYEKILHFNKLLENIEQLLMEETGRDILETGVPGLLQLHITLTMACDFQDQSQVLARISSDDVQRTMQRVFTRLPDLVEKFRGLFKDIIYDLVEAVRTENKSLLIRLFKIVEKEEREDMKIMAIRNIIATKERELEAKRMKKLPNNYENMDSSLGGKNEEYPTSAALAQEIMVGTIQTRVNERGFRDLFFSTIDRSISEMFVEVRKTYDGEKKFEVLNNLDWVINELLIVKSHLCELCPENWKLFDVFFDAYYRELHNLITGLVNAEPETLVILDILDYDKTFQANLRKEFGFKKEDLKSVIGDKQKEKLFEDYLNLIVSKMKEWITNLVDSEMTIFVERTTPPHVDSEGLLFLDGTKTCFQMFSQQVEVAAGSGQAKILVGVIDSFCKILGDRQEKWKGAIASEVSKSVSYNQRIEKDPELVGGIDAPAGGLVEYLIAVANDQMRAADYAVALSQRSGAMVSKVHEKTISNSIEHTLDGFADVAKSGTSGLISLMFDDLRTPFSQIFGKSWYSGNQAQQIADTLFEYLGDIREQMNPFVYSTLVENVVEETILTFLECLKYEHSFKNKNNKFLDCMKRDFEVFYKLFAQFVPEEEHGIIDEKFKLMEFFMDFSCGPSDSILETWTQFLEFYWDCPVSFLSAVLKCRKDIDSSALRSISSTAQRILAAPQRLSQIRSEDRLPTYISRFKAF
ncbi:LAMI_0E10396g1_1 [Lachancea mirantina]|uniref:LAMI_0E10396g1_1 n=1 Tax=Lachancea mirantina TaxID=1230905 RepID=A0A1G4JNY5_9SACH|nr:LAMI_0E10396g1_1 [Lachancea mirantina]